MPRPYPDPTRPRKTFVFDLETTGLIQKFEPDVRGDVGISEFALREAGKGGGYQRFTNLLQDPLAKFDAGDIDARTFAEILQARSPTGTRWQKGFMNPENVLHGVLERHVDVTRNAVAGRGDVLAKESKLVSLMTRYLRQGHNIKGWNLDFDMTVMSRVAARSSPAVHQRWSRALNMARRRGQIEDMATGAKKFMFLAAQESMMQGKSTGREFFTLGQVDKDLVNRVKSGKLSVDEIEKLTHDKIFERHEGFEEFFKRRLNRKGQADISFERYSAWLRKKHSYLNRPDVFATGQKYPNIRMVKGWSADILLGALAPEGIKGSTLESKAMALAKRQGLRSHEALSDTVYEEILDDIFRVKSKTWSGSWREIAPRLREYGISSQEEFFHRYRSSIERKAKSQLREHALEATRTIDNKWERVLTNRAAATRSAASDIAHAARSQPETLRRIYSRAGAELSDKWRMLKTTHPKVAIAAQIAAAAAITDYLIPEREPQPKGIRDPNNSPYSVIDGISFGPGQGVTKALTDFGSGRAMFNPRTVGFEEIARERAKLWINDPNAYEGIERKRWERNYDLWSSARSAAKRDVLGRGDYSVVRAAYAKTRGLNRSAWVGLMDLKDYRVKVEDADTVTLQRKGIVGMFRKPVSIRLAGIDAPEVQHAGFPTSSTLVQDQFAGKQASEYLEQLIERQQSLRLVVDPRSRTYNRNVGVLIGNRDDNLNLQMVRSGAAASLPFERNKRSIIDSNVFNEAEAKAAAGGVGMWQSKGWQMHRALGIIAGERVTNATLTNAEKIAKSNALMAWYGIVQNAHDDKKRWTPQEMQRMYQIGGAYRAQITGAINEQRAMVGPLPGLRKPYSPWHIAGHGINPSSMRGANVSDFGSGRQLLNEAQLTILPTGDNPIADALRNRGMSMGEFQHLRATKWGRRIGKVYEAAHLTSHGKNAFDRSLTKQFTKILETKYGSGGIDPFVTWAFGVAEGRMGASDINPLFEGIADKWTKGPRGALKNLAKSVKQLYRRGMDDANILDVIHIGRRGLTGDLVDTLRDAKDGCWAWDKIALDRRHKALAEAGAARAPRAIPEHIQQRIWAGEVHREETRARQLLMRRAEHRPPRVAVPSMLDAPASRPGRQAYPGVVRAAEARMTAKAPAAKPVEKAIKEATKEVVEDVVSTTHAASTPAAMSSRATKTIAHGRGGHALALGIGAVAAVGAAIGAWSLLRNKNEDDARAMTGMRTYSPGEFVGMKSHPPFYSSSKAASWAEHKAMGQPSQGMSRWEKARLFGEMAMWRYLPVNIFESPALKAWDYFYNARGAIIPKGTFGSAVSNSAGKGLIVQSHARLYESLQKQGFTQAEIMRWMDQMKTQEGFIAKISKDLSAKGWVGRVAESWEGIKKWPTRVTDLMSGKKSKLTKGYAQTVKQWFSSLNTKIQAKTHGVSAETYTRLAKVGQLSQLSRSKHVYSWARQKDNFKFLWQRLYKQAGSFGAKADGARQIFANLGKLEQMRMSLQEGLLGLSPGAIGRNRNMFTKTGQRLKIYMNKSKFFAGKFPRAAGKVTKFANKLKAFGVTKAGRVLGKLPLANMAFGILEGVSYMDQYESATKGFMIETAAGTAGSVVETAILSSTVVAAGKAGFWAGVAIGEAIFPAGGGIVGGILGAIVGVVGSIAAGIIAGQVTRAGVRGAGKLALGARMKRTVDPAAYQGPETLYPMQGYTAMRQNSPRTFTKLHGLDPARPDLVPFGGPYNPIQGQDIDTRTLQIANNRRRVTAKPRSPRPISMFTPTFGLVNNVLWHKRKGSKVRSVVERGASHPRLPRQHRNASRMLSHAA